MDNPSVPTLGALQTRFPPVRARSRVRSPPVPGPRYPAFHHGAHSSAGDISVASDSDPEHGYQTDFTVPDSAGYSPEDMQPDDVEDFRDREYPQLNGKVYLDHGGTTLYAKSLIDEFAADMVSNLYGNPHSASTPSAVAGHRVDRVRERALRFFNADPEHFDLVFVANATAAIKLVADCFRDHAAASNTPVWYGYHRDAHTSLVGVRESTKLHRCFTSDEEVELWINSGGLGGPRARQIGLFAYPGQSNMTGRRLPLSWPGRIRKHMHKAATYTLLDAAALASTSPLDLSDPATAPDFVALSFYKIFGFPNIGALIVRKDSAHVLENRKFFGGGTVEMVIAVNDVWHAKKDTSLHDRLEDGTLPFHSIFALDHAISVHERLYGPNPMKFISHHTAQLGRQLYDGLCTLKHSNGVPLCRVYKDVNAIYGDPSLQGATVAFNVQLSDGGLIGFAEVEAAADERNIYVRSGSLCNPGGVATYLDWSPAEMKAAFAAGHRCSHPTQIMLGKPTGVVRVSLGGMSVASDIHALLRFLREVYIDQVSSATMQAQACGLPEGMHATSGPMSPLSTHPHSFSPADVASPAASAYEYARPWETGGGGGNRPTLHHSISSPNLDVDAHKPPPFNPADYTYRRKPWEEEMRKHAAVSAAEIRAFDDGNSATRSQTTSVKARRFGRSVANFLRSNKGPGIEARPPIPDTTSPDPPRPVHSQRSYRNFDQRT